MVFFVDNKQEQTIKQALSLVREPGGKMSRAARSALALAAMAEYYINNSGK
jgi:hypothetical protein